MSDKSAREKAIDKIYSLTKLAEHPNTPAHEADAARNRIKALQDKYGITEPSRPGPKATPKNDRWTGADREAQRRKAQEDAARIRERRAQAQRDWEAKMRNRDQYGRPLTEEERREAQRDPFSWAQRQDGRSHQQRAEDMKRAWGQQNRTPQEPRCEKPETYFDAGGRPRPRNQHVINCDRCNRRLNPGEGTLFKVGSNWVGRCCEMTPGPRKRRFD